jgi:cysteinyl-tRNA synthetase
MSAKYLGETFDIHGGGMDLKFPHHENELAQSESASGKPFVKYCLHNGLTKIKTKLAGGELKVDKISKSLGNAVSASGLLDTWGPELLRYMLLSTHYRSPIEFTDEVLQNSKKGLAVFTRLWERIERIAGKAPADGGADMDQIANRLLESEVGNFVRQIIGDKMRFLEMMDDDFNTAGAIAVMHEMAGAINAFIEHNKAETDRQPDVVQAAAAAAQSLRKLGQILGLFRVEASASRGKEPGTVDQLMELLILVRNEARKTKQFGLADSVRDGLKKIGITLEDRADGTGWRRE